MTTKYDYDALEREFVEGDMSVRALAEAHGIASWSTVNAQSKKRNWPEKREEFQRQLTIKTIDRVTTDLVAKRAKIEETFLTVIEASLMNVALNMRDRTVDDYDFVKHEKVKRVVPGVQITPTDIVKMIGAMQTLAGKPSSIGEERHVEFDLSAFGLPAELLREVADVTAADDPGAARRAALPSRRSPAPN